MVSNVSCIEIHYVLANRMLNPLRNAAIKLQFGM